MTLSQLAALAGVSTSYVSQVERGVAKPTLASLKTLAGALGLTIGSMVDGSMVDGASRPAAGRTGPGGLSSNLRKQMEVIWVGAPPGGGGGGHPHQHEAEE